MSIARRNLVRCGWVFIRALLIFWGAVAFIQSFPCRDLDCLLSRNPPITRCVNQDWACLEHGQVHRAPDYVAASAKAFLSTALNIDFVRTNGITIVSMVVHPIQPILYVNVMFKSCDSVGWCSERIGYVLQYSRDGWRIVNDGFASRNEVRVTCSPIYAFMLYGVGRDRAFYYGRIDTKRSICTNYENRQIMRYKDGTPTIFQNHAFWSDIDGIQWQPESEN